MFPDRGDRTYHVGDDRLRAFRALPAADKLRWVEELAAFLRLARPVEGRGLNEDDAPAKAGVQMPDLTGFRHSPE
jgi:hypothetical protein